MIEFESYKSGLLASYESQLKSPVALADNATRLRFDNFPKGHWSKPKTYEEQIADAKSLSYEDVQRCVKDFAKISHARVGVVGNLHEQDIRALWVKAALTNSEMITLSSVQAVMINSSVKMITNGMVTNGLSESTPEK